MAFTEALRLLITADTAGAVHGIEQVGRTTERELSRSEKSLDRWGSRLTSVGAGLVSFGAVAAFGLNKAAQSAGQLEQAVGGTEAVFDDATGVIDRYAKSAAQDAGLSETAFRTATTSIGGNLKRLGLDVDEAADRSVELTQVAADLAATYGGTTAEAVTALGAAFRGEADPAERFNLDLKVSKVNAEAVALGLATSTSAVSDHARAQALLSLIMKQSADAQGQFGRESDTLAGRQQILSAQFENLKADIGAGVIPTMQKLFDVAQFGIGAFSGLNSATGGALGQLATVGTVAALGVGGLSLVIGQAIKMRQTIADAASGIGDLVTKLRNLSAGQVALAGFAAGITAIAIGLDQYNKAEQQANTQRLTSEFLAAGESVRQMEEVIKSAVKHGPAELIGVFDELAQSNREAAQRFIETAEAAGASGRLIAEMKDHLETTAAAERQTADDSAELAGAMDEQATATEDAKTQLQGFADALAGLTDPVFAAANAITGVRDAQLGLRDAEAEVFLATAALNEAMASGDQNAVAEATRGLEDANRNLSDAQWATVESAAEADSALAGLQDAVENGDITVDQFKTTLAQWVTQGFLTQQQADLAAASVGGLVDQAATADQQRVEIPVSTPGAASAISEADILADRISRIPRHVTINVDALIRTIASQVGAGDRPTGKQHGGPVEAGRAYIVGEHRPELFVPDRSGMILPSVPPMAAPVLVGSGGGGTTHVTETINIVLDGRVVAETVRRYDRNNAMN